MKEKRLATILYADLTGFAYLTSKLGPEKIAEFVNECFKKIDSIIHIHGGTILRHEGDRVMAAFGFPKSQGNDSYCAILSAIRIREAVKNLSHPIEAHIGIATGEVICDNDNIYGYVIETASQLEEEAPVGEIYTDTNCQELNKTFFEFEKISKDHKDFYRLLAEKKFQRQYENQFVNRKNELTTLSNFINELEKIIIIVGEPGIGKTRLIYETISRINENTNKFNFLQTSFLTTRSSQFYEPILKIITELDPNYEPKADINLLSEAYNIKLYNELCETIFAASKIKPLILLLQYFDKVDKDSLEFFKFLINNIEDQKTILIFEMHRLHEFILDVLKSVAKFELQIVELTQLNKETQLKIVSDLLVDADVPNNTFEEITRHAGGNPLFLSEVCHYIKGQHTMGKLTNEIKIPYRIKEVFNYLIDHIPLGIFNTLSIGALYGYSIDRKFLETTTSNFNETVNYALDKGIIELNEEEIIFKNPFFRDEICNRIPKSVRQEIHRKIASILREKFSNHDTDRKLAYHFKECGDYELALHYALKLAKKLKDMHASEMALDAYNDALTISHKINNKAEYRILIERIELLNLLGKRREEKMDIERLTEIIKEKNDEELFLEVLLSKGRYLESISDFDKATKLYESYNKKVKDVRILERLGMSYYHKSNFSKAIESLNETLRIAQLNKDINKEAKTLHNLGVVFWKRGENESSLEYCNKALDLFDSIDDDISKAHVIATMGNVYLHLNRYDEALECYNKALNVANKIGDIVFKSRMLTNIGIIYGRFGNNEKALNNYKQALAIDKAIMHKKGEAIVMNNIGHVYGTVGQFEEAISYFNDALKINEEIGDKTGISIRFGNLGNCYMHMGQFSKAIDYLQKALNLSLNLNLSDYISYYKIELTTALLYTNKRLNEAIKLAQDATNLARKVKNINYEITGLTNLALGYMKIGDSKKAFKHSRIAVNMLDKLERFKGNKANVYYNHHQILKTMNKNDEAYKYLEKAYRDIKERGDRISDKNWKKSFCTNIKQNKEVIEEWEVLRNRK